MNQNKHNNFGLGEKIFIFEKKMIERKIENLIIQHFNKQKAILLFGARQVGKTTLLENLKHLKNSKTLFLSGDEPDIRELLSNATSKRLETYFEDYEIVVIDEAQEISNIGNTIKLITDKLKNIQVIATGSSAFELADKTSEPLTGRKYEFFLFPLTFSEMVANTNLIEEKRLLEHRLIYGYYPEIVTKTGEEEKHLRLIANSYLYKDLLRLDSIRRTDLIEKLLKAIALQIGYEVTYSELAQLCNTDSKTVERYIDAFQKAYIIFVLPAFSKNVRNEIKKGKKIYFWDNGIRNAVINNLYNIVSYRTDIVQLWENFLVSERMKMNIYNKKNVNCYFWRTTQQQEIDFVEEKNNEYSVYEFKWNPKSKAKLPLTFQNSYKVNSFEAITPANVEEFLL